MSEGLRAEDVKEALDDYERVWVLVDEAPVFDTLAAAARAWLVSQATTEGRYVEPTAGSSEQAPDYQAANDEWDRDVVRMFDAAHEYDNDDWLLKRLTRCVDAALVGFHPQTTESPEVPT